MIPSIVGFSVLPQQIPLAVIVAPPSSEITPPLVAVDVVMLVTGVVDKEGKVAGSSFLQAVTRINAVVKTIAGNTKYDLFMTKFILVICAEIEPIFKLVNAFTE